MTLRTSIATVLIMFSLAPAAFAQTVVRQNRPETGVRRPDGVAARQRMQQRRIQLNQRRGNLTTTERGRLLAQQRQIRAFAQRLRKSGATFSRAERLRLHRQLNQLSRSIRRFGHR